VSPVLLLLGAAPVDHGVLGLVDARGRTAVIAEMPFRQSRRRAP